MQVLGLIDKQLKKVEKKRDFLINYLCQFSDFLLLEIGTIYFKLDQNILREQLTCHTATLLYLKSEKPLI